MKGWWQNVQRSVVDRPQISLPLKGRNSRRQISNVLSCGAGKLDGLYRLFEGKWMVILKGLCFIVWTILFRCAIEYWAAACVK
jgi:hypothetical protein